MCYDNTVLRSSLFTLAHPSTHPSIYRTPRLLQDHRIRVRCSYRRTHCSLHRLYNIEVYRCWCILDGENFATTKHTPDCGVNSKSSPQNFLKTVLTEIGGDLFAAKHDREQQRVHQPRLRVAALVHRRPQVHAHAHTHTPFPCQIQLFIYRGGCRRSSPVEKIATSG